MDRHEIQKGFTTWLDNVAVVHSLSNEFKGRLREVLGKEVDWVVRNKSYLTDAVTRLAKQDAQIAASDDGDISNFDPYWVYRREFLQWILT